MSARKWNPTDIRSLQPWPRSRASSETPAEYACAVQHAKPVQHLPAEYAMAAIAGAVFAAFLAGWL